MLMATAPPIYFFITLLKELFTLYTRELDVCLDSVSRGVVSHLPSESRLNGGEGEADPI